MQCYPGKHRVLAFMWMPLDTHHPPKHRRRPPKLPPVNDNPRWQWPPSSTKTGHEWPEEHGKEPNVGIWSLNSTDPILTSICRMLGKKSDPWRINSQFPYARHHTSLVSLPWCVIALLATKGNLHMIKQVAVIVWLIYNICLNLSFNLMTTELHSVCKSAPLTFTPPLHPAWRPQSLLCFKRHEANCMMERDQQVSNNDLKVVNSGYKSLRIWKDGAWLPAVRIWVVCCVPKT